MRMPRLFRFVLTHALVGIAVAAAIVTFAPDLLTPERPVVELREAAVRDVTDAPATGPVSYAAAVERAAPAVVNVFTTKRVRQSPSPFYDDPLLRRFFGEGLAGPSRERVETSLGSGVIVSEEGFVLTNNHVIAGADEIRVWLHDGRSAVAKVVGTDPATDLAVLKLDIEDIPAITIGDSIGIRVGDVVMAIGNPFGVGQTVTQGIVSATERNQLGISTFENFIQTDAAINPGNSGGALINAYGELIGINTAIFSRTGGSQGIGFAIPTRLAEDVLRSIIEHGRVVRGWIGVEVQKLNAQLAESFGLPSPEGVVVAGVLRGGPADASGLRPGDVILEIDDTPIRDPNTLLSFISGQMPGQRLNVTGWRDGDPFEANIKIVERPAAQTRAR